MSRRNVRRKHPQWWDRPGSCYRVWHSATTSYLVYFPRWGPPWIAHHVPRLLRYGTPPDFLEVFDFYQGLEMKKPPVSGNNFLAYAASPDDWLDLYPLLVEHLTATAYDGEAAGTRATSTLLIFAQDGTWRAVLRDRQAGRCLWVSCLGAEELLQVLENALGDPGAIWRDDRASGAETARRQNQRKAT